MYLKNGKDQMTFLEKHLKGKYVTWIGTIVDARGNCNCLYMVLVIITVKA